MVTLVEDTITQYDEAIDDNAETDVEEIIGADIGESLVLRRVLNTTQVDDTDKDVWKRNNIF